MPIHDHQPAFRGRAFFWGGIGLGLLLVVILLTHGFGFFTGPGNAPEAAPWMVRQGGKILIPEGSPLRSRISVEPAAAQQRSGKLALPGLVESDPARTANVIPPLSGRVVDLKVRLGDRVVKGQTLVVLDSSDLAQAYADYDKATDAYRLTHKNLERQQEQAKIGVASERDLDQSRSDDAQAAAESARAEQRLKTLEAPLDSRGSARRLVVRSPLSGSVTALAVTPGSTINDPTQPLMTVADLTTIWVTAMVPEKDIDKVAKNLDAEVVFVAYPDKPRHGKVLFVSDVIEADSRRNKLRIAFANEDYALKPNMFASVTLAGPAIAQVVLPSSSLLMNNDRTSVFVATAPWTFERRIVDPQLDDGPTVAIRTGVSAGEQVVTKGGILLND
jgi:cobalt-zinc-cadmium efflux system membrane fusion protein